MNHTTISAHKLQMAEGLRWALLLDTWPPNAACGDFGVTSEVHYAALQFAVRTGGVTVQQLAHVLGKGDEITTLVRTVKGNPYPDITYVTCWDDPTLEPGHG
jgi:hypothetical protein